MLEGAVGLPTIPPHEFKDRLHLLRQRMVERGLDFTLIWGDEKHYENVKYITGFDPRFESALVVVGRSSEPIVLTGVESANIFDSTGRLGRAIPFLPLSIEGASGTRDKNLEKLLLNFGLRGGHRVGLVGSRHFKDVYPKQSTSVHFVPHYVWDAVRRVVQDSSELVNCTDMFTEATSGLRSVKSAHEIIVMEAASVVACRGISRMMDVVRPGMTELELMAEGLQAGKAATFAFQPTVVSGYRCYSSLLSPSSKRLGRGEPVSMHYGPTVDGYCGNVDRLGLLVSGPDDLPNGTKDIVHVLYQPMYDAYVSFLRRARVGATGAELYSAVVEPLLRAGLDADLNAGHLIGLAEWEGTYTTADSRAQVQSGHVMQVDLHVLTLLDTHGPARIQEGVAFADESLRGEIERIAPQTWKRIQARRERVAALGIATHKSLLLLSDLTPVFRPFILDKRIVLMPTIQQE